MANDPYTVLGVDASASKEEIKKAYKKLASKHHPDRGGDTEKFQEIQAAYELVKDGNYNAQPEFDLNDYYRTFTMDDDGWFA